MKCAPGVAKGGATHDGERYGADGTDGAGGGGGGGGGSAYLQSANQTLGSSLVTSSGGSGGTESKRK